MPLSAVTLNASINWTQQHVNAGGFQNTTQGPDSQAFSLANINISTFNELYTASFTIANSSSQTIDCTSLTNLVGESFTYGHVLAIMVIPTVNMTLAPGASNPLTWFFGGSTQSITVPGNGGFLWSNSPTATGTVVSGTAKTLTISNSSGASGTVDVTIVGSTT